MSGICSKHQHYDKDCEICNAKYGVNMKEQIMKILPAKKEVNPHKPMSGDQSALQHTLVDVYNMAIDECAEAIERAVKEGKLSTAGMTDKEINQYIDKAFCMTQEIEARRVIDERT